MIFLLATVLVILPLAMLDCLKRRVEDEPTLLPYSTMEKTAPLATSKEALPAPTPPSKSPLPPQPVTDAANSTHKKSMTDKTGSRSRTAKSLPFTPSPYMFNAFAPPRRSRTRQKSQSLELKTASSRGAPSQDRNKGRDQGRRTPIAAPRPLLQQMPSSGPPGSQKKSRKSRKNLPKSRSWKEYPAKPKVALTQSNTNLTAPAVMNNSEAPKSALTALSEYVFQESKFKVLGRVDAVIGEADEVGVLNRALDTDQSMTCHSVTNPARSPYFDGQFDVWVADKVGSQADG